MSETPPTPEAGLELVFTAKTLALLLALCVLLSVGISTTLLRWIVPPAPTGQFVIFDVVKFMNAQRRVASAFLVESKAEQQAEASLVLRAVPARVRSEIDLAAAGAVVLVKQGVVGGNYLDITDSVLKALGLPTDVPTQNPVDYALDVAPTNWLTPPASGRAPNPALRQGGALIP